MKLRTKAVSDTAFLHLRDADGELMFDGDPKDGRKVGVVLYGPGSLPYQEMQSRSSNRTIDRVKSKGKADVTTTERLMETAESLAAITVSFEHVEVEGPDEQPLTGHDLAIAVYSDPQLGFIANQVNGWAGDWANFTKGSATS